MSPRRGGLILAGVLWLASVVLLAGGLSLPTVTFFTLASPLEVYSSLGGVRSLWSDGNGVLATVVFGFSVVLPTVKLVLLARALAGARTSPRDATREAATLDLLRTLGKWSMLDVFLVAAFVGGIRLGLASATSRAGIHVFTLAVLLSMVCAIVLQRALAPGRPATPTAPPASGGPRGVARLLALASAALLAAALASPVLCVSRGAVFRTDFAPLPSAVQLWLEREHGVALELLVFVCVLPALRAVLALGAAFGPVTWRRRLDGWCERADEWAMLEVFALALLIVRVKFDELATTRLYAGYPLVLAAAACALADGLLRRRRLRAD